MVKVLFRRPCHVPPCLINGEGGSKRQERKHQSGDPCLLVGVAGTSDLASHTHACMRYNAYLLRSVPTQTLPWSLRLLFIVFC